MALAAGGLNERRASMPATRRGSRHALGRVICNSGEAHGAGWVVRVEVSLVPAEPASPRDAVETSTTDMQHVPPQCRRQNTESLPTAPAWGWQPLAHSPCSGAPGVPRRGEPVEVAWIARAQSIGGGKAGSVP